MTKYEKMAAEHILLKLYCDPDSMLLGYHEDCNLASLPKEISLSYVRDRLISGTFPRTSSSSSVDSSGPLMSTPKNPSAVLHLDATPKPFGTISVSKLPSRLKYDRIEAFIFDMNQLFVESFKRYGDQSTYMQQCEQMASVYIQAVNDLLPLYRHHVDLSMPNERNLRKKRGSKLLSLIPSNIMQLSRSLAQEKLKSSSALIVGAGGLGCPVATYICAAGIEISNLHRQVAHSSYTLGWNKAKSLAEFCKNLNETVDIVTFEIRLNSKNAVKIIRKFDIVCDCTDNVPTRFLLNDACFLAGKSLVSGSALRWDGQLTIYNFENGPCYRCLFPDPPPPETVVGCAEGGVLGVVPGIIGNMQALETIKILTGLPTALKQTLILFDGLLSQFRHIKLRSKNPECKLCGSSPSILDLIDYEKFCRMCASDQIQNVNLLSSTQRISVRELHENRSAYLLLDCLPLKEIEKTTKNELAKELRESYGENQKLAVICHRGNDSQLAVVRLKEALGENVCVVDVEGGLKEWATKIDFNFPQY
uniref:Rhodanese domain-containing protein n=1 Tax=Romanomermis culicivorax TaxID=13658 RepID=A0A915HQ14_ROMCU